MGFYTSGGKKSEISDKTLSSAIALFEELDQPRAKFVSQESAPATDEMVGVDSLLEETDLTTGGKPVMELLQAPHDRVSSTVQAKVGHVLGRYSSEIEENVKEPYTNGDYSNVKPCITDGIAPEFVGFHTASGKHVSISSEALAKAKATMKKIDNSLDLHEGQYVNSQREIKLVRYVSQHQATWCTLKKSRNKELISNVLRKGDDHIHVSGFEKQQSSVLPGFCGFSTASGKQVQISDSAMKKARKTLSEIDAELTASNSDQALKVTSGKGRTIF
ncbi:Breast cancer 2, early onset [Desmophyllum pertusum]|uniref:Breast cancer 2, early onset n=1 Tax=Desmophyllum pertusum TaxID=174260 RepID=A0A9X0CQK6_9CNID|nr:Breast cancer 2, early onset [Desmophyllum pertusum]